MLSLKSYITVHGLASDQPTSLSSPSPDSSGLSFYLIWLHWGFSLRHHPLTPFLEMGFNSSAARSVAVMVRIALNAPEATDLNI